MSKANFKLMLEYLDGLHGNQRGLAKRRAEEVMSQSEEDKDEGKEVQCSFFLLFAQDQC